MNGRSSFGRLLRAEATLFARSPVAVVWTALLPVVALVVLGCFHRLREPSADLDGLSYLAAYLPILMAFSLCMSAVNLLPPNLALYREKGILKRLSATPVPPVWLLAAQAAVFATISIVVSVILFGVGASFGIPVPKQLFGFVLTLVLIAAATLALGVLVAALAFTSKAANAAGMALFFPLMFLAGLWVPRAQMPRLLRTISDYSPLGAGVHGLQEAISGHWPPPAAVTVLLVWAVLPSLLAIRFFRWE
jgi:ABC-2 type transport system permease protein